MKKKKKKSNDKFLRNRNAPGNTHQTTASGNTLTHVHASVTSRKSTCCGSVAAFVIQAASQSTRVEFHANKLHRRQTDLLSVIDVYSHVDNQALRLSRHSMLRLST
ncbi:uncharacterized [Tachysurus ichikawai]